MRRGNRSNASGTSRAALVLAAGLLCGCSASDVWAQAPPPKPKPSEKKKEEAPPSPKAAATLLVKVDEACELSVNGGAARKVAAGETARLPVQELGDQFLEAKAADGLVWSQVVTVLERGQRFVETGLAGLRVKRDAERAAERKAKEERERLTIVRGSLRWLRRDNGSEVDWHQAKAYCDGLSLEGHDDWRLPTIQELRTVHDPRANGRFKLVSGIELTGCCPWSSTMYDSSSAWFVEFFEGESNAQRLGSTHLAGRALCVRSPGE